jgi:hypothetical protein
MPTKEDLLRSLTVKQLRQLAKENKIRLVKEGFLWDYKASTKDDIIEILLESPKITKKKIQAIMKPLPAKRIPKKEVKPRIERAKPEAPEVKRVLRKIKRFKPFKRAKKERELEAMLVSHLAAFYPNIRTQLTYERARIDAQIGRIGIEIKYQPSTSDFDRLYGQLDRYLKHLDHVITIIGYEKSAEDTRAFKKRLKERGWLNTKVSVVTL